MMQLNELSPQPGSVKKRKRVGRGTGSGHGKTSCKGHKGQKARSGGGVKAGFEGGQMPLQRRLPKRGFRSRFQKEYSIVNLSQLDKLEGVSEINPETFVQQRLVKNFSKAIKVLAKGEIRRGINLKVHAVSEAAKEKIIRTGGRVEILPFVKRVADIGSQ